MKKLDMESINIVNENIEIIGNIFPNTVVETEDGIKIDFDILKQELSNEIIVGNKERYGLTWPGRNAAKASASIPSQNTLRPMVESSVDFENTKNIYIEGDNLETLKLLQESYLNKIKCIYIDPPYNTGNDFIYNDKFKKDEKDELIESGQIDEIGNKLVSNKISNGRFHSDWLSMMYSRLLLSKKLLTEDGVVFISIDDNEHSNLTKLAELVFGDNNVEQMIWDKISNNDNAGTGKMKITYRFRRDHEYIIVCYKNKDNCLFNKPQRLKKTKNEYGNIDNDPRGNWISSEICKSEEKSNPNGKNYYTITTPAGLKITRQWHFSETELNELINDNRIYWGNGKIIPRLKKFLSEPTPVTPSSILSNIASQTDGNNDLKELGLEFSNPKPVNLIKWLIEIGSDKDSYVLDFFSGSATTAHAVMQLNAEDNGNRKFIMIQLPEQCDNCQEYKTICDIGQERIRRAATKIKKETNAIIDYGFRVYKIDSSNMKDVYYKPDEIVQEQLNLFETNIKEDRTTDDLLTQVILDLGLTLDLKIEQRQILNNKIYCVEGNLLITCFDDNINLNIIEEISKYKPLKVVFKDSSFETDEDKINLQEKFKRFSPNTEINIL